jgi:hypothetical protein
MSAFKAEKRGKEERFHKAHPSFVMQGSKFTQKCLSGIAFMSPGSHTIISSTLNRQKKKKNYLK